MPKDLVIIIITFILVGISFIVNRDKTLKGLQKGGKILLKLLPQFLLLLTLISVFLGIVTPGSLANLLGQESGILGVAIAAFIGSIALIPGPIAYPMAGMLLKSGVSYTVLATFITTLMMVGILTFPVEKEYLGIRLAIMRNVLSFIGALLISLFLGGLL